MFPVKILSTHRPPRRGRLLVNLVVGNRLPCAPRLPSTDVLSLHLIAANLDNPANRFISRVVPIAKEPGPGRPRLRFAASGSALDRRVSGRLTLADRPPQVR